MKSLAVLSGAAILVVALNGSALAQASGAPSSAFPLAAPHEIVWLNGVPCRTALDSGDRREIVACAEPGATGSIATVPAAPHEVVDMNGVPCRILLNNGETRRLVACGQ